MSDDLYETLKQTAIDHLKAYDSPDPWKPDPIQKFRTPDCIHYIHPTESIPESFRAIDHEHFKGSMAFFSPVLESSTFEVKEAVVDVKQKTVAARVTAIYDFKAIGNEPAEKGFTADYVVLTEHDDSGKKIKRIVEYLDVQRMMEYVRGKAERYAELNKASG